MKTKIAFVLVLFALLLALPARAVDVITATIAVTNAVGTTNGQTIAITNTTGATVGYSVRTWTNSVVVPGIEILTNNTAAKAATNLYNQLSTYPIALLSLSYVSTNSVALRAFPGTVTAVTLSAGWGTVTYATNVITSAVVVRVPNTVEVIAQRTNIATGLVDWLNLPAATNQINQASPALAQLVGTTNAQTVSGNKTFTGSNVFSAVFTERFMASNANANIYLQGGLLYMGGSAVIMQDPNGSNVFSVNPTQNYMSYPGTPTNLLFTALPTYAVFRAPGNITTLGWDTNQTFMVYYTNGVLQGHISLTNGGIATVGNVKHNSALEVTGVSRFSGGVSNLVTVGTNSHSDIALRRYAITSLANGNNAGVIIGTNSFVEVSGPSAAFAINGMTGSPARDGHLVVIVNQTGFDMTIAHQSGTDPVAANRIITLTGADRTTTGNGSATFIYSLAASRWLLISFDP